MKRTRPTTQAAHWFSQALFKAMLLRDSNSHFESLMVLPDYARYRDLALRTANSRAAAVIHIAFMKPDGTIDSSTWAP
nr:hypothetical protein [Catellatospora sichuanensis]